MSTELLIPTLTPTPRLALLAFLILIALTACGGGGGDKEGTGITELEMFTICNYYSKPPTGAPSRIVCRVILYENEVNGRIWPATPEEACYGKPPARMKLIPNGFAVDC